MGRKKLTPEDIKIHVDSIYFFLQEEKPLSEIVKFNSRFTILKSILLKKKIISLRKEKYGKKRNRHFYKATPSFVIFPKDYEDILQFYQKNIDEQNQKSVDNIENRFIKKTETKENLASGESIKSTFDLSNTKIWIGFNKELSKRVQQKAFELGWTWDNGKTEIYTLGINCLYFKQGVGIGWGMSRPFFDSHEYREIFESDLFPETKKGEEKEDLKFSEQELDNIIEKYKKAYYDQ